MGAATFKMNSCSDGLCQPLAEESQNFAPFIAEALKDPCLVHCALKHEWYHFSDMRLWKLDALEIDLVRFWELPAYEVEAQCLKAFWDAR